MGRVSASDHEIKRRKALVLFPHHDSNLESLFPQLLFALDGKTLLIPMGMFFPRGNSSCQRESRREPLYLIPCSEPNGSAHSCYLTSSTTKTGTHGQTMHVTWPTAYFMLFQLGHGLTAATISLSTVQMFVCPI